MTLQHSCLPRLFFLAILTPATLTAAAITVAPAAQTVGTGSTFQASVVVSGLTAARVGDFDITLTFNPSFLQVTAVTFGPFLGSPSSLQSSLLGGNQVEFAEVSLLASSDLLALQPATFTLATITFQAIGVGTTAISFSAIIAGDQSGALLDLAPTDGSATVSGVPEPSSLTLVGLGLLLASGRYFCRTFELPVRGPSA